eukprot:CAMPEP_0178411732 /NCGR_PEP_ID=MMETSP0689_2-20121128/21645_1 /TAXON_ID=160604 /ORGANISM="Amphidinium massartii, Strain CS-259" /LENGTH=223 /DNA_ID=CAMNT_0020032945 /DNA_START=61 /DNA_END=732 /DNA_ORIENTATION=+
MQRYFCCCVNTASAVDQVGVTGDMLGGSQTGSAETATVPPSSVPQFPTPDPSKAKQGAIGGPSPRDLDGSASARSNVSGGSTMSSEEKEREKLRLQRLVKDFAKEAVTGIAISLVNAETTRQSPHFFQMDRYLTVFSLKPKDGSTAESSVQDFNVKDLTAIYKGVEVAQKAPSLGALASQCVGLDTNRADRRLFFHFDDSYERDKFYTCLKILRMSVDINRST